MADIESDVLDVIARQANVARNTLSADTPLESLHLESLDYVEIIFELEEKYDVSINYSADQTELQSKTIRAVIEMVAADIKSAQPLKS